MGLKNVIVKLVYSVKDLFCYGTEWKKLISLLFLAVQEYIIYTRTEEGEGVIGYIYTRERFNWDESNFSIYLTYVELLNLAGASIVVGFFSNYLKMEDTMLGSITSALKVMTCFMYTLAATVTSFYIATFFDIFGGGMMLAMRSVASKLVSSDELGKINSLIALFQVAAPTAFKPVYSYIYNHTKSSVPVAFFFLSAAIAVITLGLFLCLHFLQKNNPVEVPEVMETNGCDDKNEKQPHDGIKNDAFESSEGSSKIIITRL